MCVCCQLKCIVVLKRIIRITYEMNVFHVGFVTPTSVGTEKTNKTKCSICSISYIGGGLVVVVVVVVAVYRC